MAMRLYDFACNLVNVDKVTPENRDSLIERMNCYSLMELAKPAGVTCSYVRRFRSMLERNPPIEEQKQFLKAVHDLAKRRKDRIISSREIHNYLNVSRLPISISFEFLELMNVIEIRRITHSRTYGSDMRLYSSIKVNLNIMKEYWPDINKWKIELAKNIIGKPVNAPVRIEYGERLRQALDIIGKSFLDELNERDIGKINELSRVDWKMRGLNISSAYLGGLKHKLRKWALRKQSIGSGT